MAGPSTALTLLLSVAIAFAGFAPNVSVDHGSSCGDPSITLGPRVGDHQPVYVVMADGQNVVFQKSTDAGMTWLAENGIVGQGGASDLTTDPDGNVYIMYSRAGHICCIASTDGGGTWSSPSKVDDNDTAVTVWGAHVAAGTNGQLFCAWIDCRTGGSHIWSSVSTNRGATWSTNVRVDDGSSGSRAYVSVQPGTGYYLVAAEVEALGACLYRSQDAGQTFEPGVRLETSSAHTAEPHVVSDREHVICDYTNDHLDNELTKARTLYTPQDTWGPCRPITDPSYNSYYSGPLAISADGRVHAALMMNYRDGRYDTYYSYSTDHGATWSRCELVNDDTTGDKWSPTIAADDAGHAYLVWEDGRESSPGIWFSTNNWSPNAEHPAQPSSFQPLASVVRDVLLLPRPAPASFSLLTSAGRKALELRSGANDVSRLSTGVYFVRDTQARTRNVSKVVITR
jgi:hypothetical protein